MNWGWRSSKSLPQPWVGAQPCKESDSAAAHSVPNRSRTGKRQSSALGLSFAPHSGCSTGRWVCAGSTTALLAAESTFWKKKNRRSKNEQLYHYLMCWDLCRDQLKDPYCLQQLMSLTSAEAVLSLKVLTYLQFSVLSLALICHFKMNAPFVQSNHLHEHSTSSKSQICFTFPLAAIL